MVAASLAKFLQLQTVLVFSLVPCRRVVAVLAVTALKRNDLTHGSLDLKPYCLGRRGGNVD